MKRFLFIFTLFLTGLVSFSSCDKYYNMSLTSFRSGEKLRGFETLSGSNEIIDAFTLEVTSVNKNVLQVRIHSSFEEELYQNIRLEKLSEGVYSIVDGRDTIEEWLYYIDESNWAIIRYCYITGEEFYYSNDYELLASGSVRKLLTH
jgi:hypothetical protein